MNLAMTERDETEKKAPPCPTCAPPPPQAVTDAQKLAEWEQLYGKRKTEQNSTTIRRSR
jgi:hypothetical protein